MKTTRHDFFNENQGESVAPAVAAGRGAEACGTLVRGAAIAGFFAFALLATPVNAQRGAPAGGSGGARPSSGSGSSTSGSASNGPVSSSPGVYSSQPTLQPGTQPYNPYALPSDLPPVPQPSVVEDEGCLPWDIGAIRGATVSVMRLEVPSKARGDFNKACNAFKKKKFGESQEHAQAAIKDYSGYVAAWVLLGQALQADEKVDKAQDACSHALSLDSSYLPPYLCLADLAAHESQWTDLLDLSNRALGLNPVGDGYAYYYQAVAYYQLGKFPEAQKSAQTAAQIDTEHRQTDVYFLLAKIYDAQGDSTSAKAELKQYLKLNGDKAAATEAKQYLAKLEGQPPK